MSWSYQGGTLPKLLPGIQPSSTPVQAFDSRNIDSLMLKALTHHGLYTIYHIPYTILLLLCAIYLLYYKLYAIQLYYQP